MKIRLKALAAAVALVAFADQVYAYPMGPTATTPSDVIFFAIDTFTGNSFVFDLGPASVISPTLSQNLNVAALNTYYFFEGKSWANTVWGLAYDKGIDPATSQWGTTVRTGDTIGQESLSQVSSGRVAFNSFLASSPRR